ncbi:MAG: copper-binding protein [Chromatiales bacterium]
MTTAGDATAVRSYTARGVVLEATDDALTVHHEAIDDFVGSDGRVIGMDPMAMRFRRGRGVGAGAVDEGDKIRFRFDVRTDGHPYLITEARKLPPGTVMDFRAARPPGPP